MGTAIDYRDGKVLVASEFTGAGSPSYQTDWHPLERVTRLAPFPRVLGAAIRSALSDRFGWAKT